MLAFLRTRISHAHRRQMALFGSVGLLCTVTDLVLYSGFVAIGIAPVVANLMSFLTANVQGYLLNSTLTFRREGKHRALSFKGYGKFLVGYLLALCLSTLIIWLSASAVGAIGAKILAIGATAFWNYCFSAFFVFREPKQPRRPSESA